MIRPVFIALMFFLLTGTTVAAQQRMMVRIAELEIDSVSLPAYKAILAEEAAASIKLEPGVIAIFPMFDKARPAQVRILEIYASREAYESHLKTAHFIKYKTATAKMVKSLRLPDMEAIDPATMAEMFRKLPAGK
ncbi:putative quinol monooxygenase [Chitinophaga caseinilytica]|uniref:Antibiotic biosynthesis monooxygenase n=1 Tax=Chitinophaga caseinilytica TaxID=2267521 RepID=A0ABZ2Z5L4_9BACT